MKKFIAKISLWGLPIFIPIVFSFVYLHNIITPNQSGDLEGLGGFALQGSKEYHKMLTSSKLDVDMVVQYEDDSAIFYDNLEYITIGDSFSQQRKIGYPNYFAHGMNTPIYNIDGFTIDNPIQNASILLNNGFFDKYQSKTVIIQSVERSIVDRVNSLSLNECIATENLWKIESSDAATTSPLKLTLKWMLLQIKDSPVIKLQLAKPLFSIEPQNIYIYQDDVLSQLNISDDELNLFASKLESLHDNFEKRGIQLILLGAVDKYDLYQDEILNNPYGRKTILDQLSSRLDPTFFVNTKTILKPLVDKGVLDVFYATDTHWTPIASRVVGEHLARMIKNK